MRRIIGTLAVLALLVSPAFASDNPNETTFSASYNDFDEGGYRAQGVATVRFGVGDIFKLGPAGSIDYARTEDGTTVKVYSVGIDGRVYLGTKTGFFVGGQVLKAFQDGGGILYVPQAGVVLGDDRIFAEVLAQKRFNSGEDGKHGRDDGDVDLDSWSALVGIGLRF